MLAALKHFFSDVRGSAQGIIVPEELFRSIATALGSGTVIGILVVILQAMLDHVVSIFPDPAIASLASISLTLILDLLRRQNHGGKPGAALVMPATPGVVPAAPVVIPATPAVPKSECPGVADVPSCPEAAAVVPA